MNRHLDDEQIAAAVAGAELGQNAAEHLGSCLVCRRRVEAMTRLIGRRRAELEAEAPDWQSQRQSILERLPEADNVVPLRRRWLRPVMALAASVLVAVGVSVLLLDRGPSGPPDEIAADQVVAEVEATLDGYGYELTGYDEILTEMETTVEDDDRQVPGLEALDMLVPGIDDLPSLIVEAS
jgi:hypothetical protein